MGLKVSSTHYCENHVKRDALSNSLVHTVELDYLLILGFPVCTHTHQIYFLIHSENAVESAKATLKNHPLKVLLPLTISSVIHPKYTAPKPATSPHTQSHPPAPWRTCSLPTTALPPTRRPPSRRPHSAPCSPACP